MEFSILSKETIKPSSLPETSQGSKPFKLCLMDQLFPRVYVPLVLFYPPNDDFRHDQISTQLKTSLSETLSIFYPFSGRVKNNRIIDNYEKGVLYIETQVKSRLFDFLQPPQVELLHQFLPFPPFSNISNIPEAMAPIAIQLNKFECGGFAIGVCMLHKIVDGPTAKSFFNNWVAISLGYRSDKFIPNFSDASLQFPPLGSLSSKMYLYLIEKLCFDKHQCPIKRFVFDKKAIATLRAIAKSEKVENPTRYEILSSFIWKSCMIAARSASSSKRFLSFCAVNIRQRTKPCLPENSIGNLFLSPFAAYNLADAEIRLPDLVALTNQALAKVDDNFRNVLQGKKRFRAMSKFLIRVGLQILLKKPEVFYFTSWLNFGVNDLNLGWGKPMWVGVSGNIGTSFRNMIIFKETTIDNGVEAWITLDETIMSKLEKDPEFLTFANPNPTILVP